MKRFVLFGAGFWAQYQLAAWQSLGRAECVAICDPDWARARALAESYGIGLALEDPAEAMAVPADFVDIVTPVQTHAELVAMAAQARKGTICQKPMARSLDEARGMVEVCARAGVPFLVHENFRWQRPFRTLLDVVRSGAIGTPFRATITAVTGFPVFQNQPALAELDDYILADMGSHIFDMARALAGEAETLYCTATRCTRGSVEKMPLRRS